MTNMTIVRKPAVVKESTSDKLVVKLPTVKSNLVIGKDKGGEVGCMITWSRLSKADQAITNLKEYMTAMAKDIAVYASSL